MPAMCPPSKSQKSQQVGASSEDARTARREPAGTDGASVRPPHGHRIQFDTQGKSLLDLSVPLWPRVCGPGNAPSARENRFLRMLPQGRYADPRSKVCRDPKAEGIDGRSPAVECKIHRRETHE